MLACCPYSPCQVVNLGEVHCVTVQFAQGEYTDLGHRHELRPNAGRLKRRGRQYPTTSTNRDLSGRDPEEAASETPAADSVTTQARGRSATAAAPPLGTRRTHHLSSATRSSASHRHHKIQCGASVQAV